MKNIYRGLKNNAGKYFVYFAFFESANGELYLKVGKSGSLYTRFRDLQKSSPLILFKAYAIDVGEFKEIADAIEYIFKRRLSPFCRTGEWFYVTEQVLNSIKYIIKIINTEQNPDNEIWDDNTFGEFFSLIGHRSEKDWPYEYDWDEIFRHNNDYKFQEIDYDLENKCITFLAVIHVDELIETIKNRYIVTGFKPEYSININSDFDFRDYFSRNECGKERKEWWNRNVKGIL